MLSKFKKRERQKLHKAHEKFSKKAMQAIAQAKARPDAQAYVNVIEKATKSDYIIFVLDTRNPLSCRSIALEQLCPNKLFVLNKIDLVPREAAIAWTKYMKSVAPTAAISAINSVDALASLLSPNISEKPNVFITGLANLGKTTIKEALLQHPDLKNHIKIDDPGDWPFLEQTPDLAAMGSISMTSLFAIGAAADFLFRTSVMSACEVFSTTFNAEQTAGFQEIDEDPGKASREILRRLASGEVKYYAAPPCESIDNDHQWISEVQRIAFKISRPIETISESYLMLSHGTPNCIKEETLTCLRKMFVKEHLE